jgi:serine/threonine protein phosphatase 1
MFSNADYLSNQGKMIAHFPDNPYGRDFVVGDVHGCFSMLTELLIDVDFDDTADRVFSVGDLVDRGPSSDAVLQWLSYPWFHAIRGNHEQMAMQFAAGRVSPDIYIANGGSWFAELDDAQRAPYLKAFEALPLAAEVESETGLIGLVHANCPVSDWNHLAEALAGPNGDVYAEECMWSRKRIQQGVKTPVLGVKAVVVGHTPVEQIRQLGNVFYIDTGAGYRRGTLTLIALDEVGKQLDR